MSSLTVTLYNFIQPVPICEPETDLETVVSIFRSEQPDKIAVVSSQGNLLGTVSSSLLLRFLTELRLSDLSRPLSLNCCLSDIKELIQPLPVLPAHISVKQLEASLTELNSDSSYLLSYGLVDIQGKFLGLLDHGKLLQFLLSNSQESEMKPSKLEQLLFEFLGQLPFPVMLITQPGEVLYQNPGWSEQLGSYRPYDLLNSLTLDCSKLLPISSNTSSYGEEYNSSLTKNFTPECIQDNRFLSVQLLSNPEIEDLSQIFPTPVKVENSDSWQRSQNSFTLHHPTFSPIPKDTSWQFLKIPLYFSTVNFSSDSVWLIMALDTTPQRNLYQELAVRNADLMQLNRVKDEFFACISHDLKSPLTSVIGLASLLKEQKLGSLNDRQIRYTELIYHSGRQLMTLVNDLLDLTRLETGQLKLKLTSVKIKSVCQKSYQSLKEKYKGKTNAAISLNLEIESGLEEVIADELRLQQMLFYLLDNALKLAQPAGEIGLKVNRWSNLIAFTIWDTGKGIPEESQTLIFQKFQQQENLLTGQLEGTGLGLVLTQRLAKAHGGDISFICRENQGNQFTLILPFNANSLETNQSYHLPTHSLVLLVESLARTIEQLTDLLIRLGYKVVIARTGTEALEKARQLRPEIIFLNPVLPLLSGWDVLKLLKSDPDTQSIRVIITSSELDHKQNEQQGADGFLKLPIDLLALQTVLGESIDFDRPRVEPLTVLRLHYDNNHSGWIGSVMDAQFDLHLGQHLSKLNYRLLEADNLEQAEMVASVWEIDVVVLDSCNLKDPVNYLQSFRNCEVLASLPLVTLDKNTTEVANQIDGLSVFPCLLPPDDYKIERLLQVIQIAARVR